MLPKMVSTMISESLRLISVARETSSISSALVMVVTPGAISIALRGPAAGESQTRLALPSLRRRFGLGRQRGGNQISRSGRGRRGCRLERSFLEALDRRNHILILILFHVVQAQSNSLLAGIETNHPEAKLASRAELARTARTVVIGHFGNVAEALDPLFQLHESAERGHPHHFPTQRLSDADL